MLLVLRLVCTCKHIDMLSLESLMHSFTAPTPTPSPTQSMSSDPSSGLSPGVIAAIIVVAIVIVVVVIIIVVIVAYLWRKNKSQGECHCILLSITDIYRPAVPVLHTISHAVSDGNEL